MPKRSPVYNIDRPYTRTNTTISIGTNAAVSGPIGNGNGNGVSDHGALSGLTDDDHTQYLNTTRGDARYYTQSEIDAWQHDRLHTLADSQDHDFTGWTEGDVLRGTGIGQAGVAQLLHSHIGSVGTDDHHNQSHDITSASDHTITASQYDLIGASAANTLGVLTPSSDISAGDTILISDASGNATINNLFLDTDLDIAYGGSVLMRDSGGTSRYMVRLSTASGLQKFGSTGGGTTSLESGLDVNISPANGVAATFFSDKTARFFGSNVDITGDLEVSGGVIKPGADNASAITFRDSGDTTDAGYINTTSNRFGVPNDGGFEAVDSTGTRRLIAGWDSSDVLTIGETTQSSQVSVDSAGTFRVRTGGANTALTINSSQDLTAESDVRISGDLTPKDTSSSGTLTLRAGNIDINNESDVPYWTINSVGELRSVSPAYNGYQGVLLTPDGYLEVQDGKYRGSISTAVLEYQQVSAVGGQMMLSKAAGRLYNDLVIDTTLTGQGQGLLLTLTYESDPGSYSVSVDIAHPEIGPYAMAEVGDILWIRAAMVRQAKDRGNSWLVDMVHAMVPHAVPPDTALDIGEIELTVTAVSDDQGAYTRYTCDWNAKPGVNPEGIFPSGTAVINLGQAGTDHGITLLADKPTESYIDLWTHEAPDYANGIYDRRRPHMRIGHIQSLTGTANEVGIIGGSDLNALDLTNATSQYFILSDQQMVLNNVDIDMYGSVAGAMRLTSNGIDIATAQLTTDGHPSDDLFDLPFSDIQREINAVNFDVRELSFMDDPSAVSPKTYSRIYNYRVDTFNPSIEDDEDGIFDYVTGGSEWHNVFVIEARHPEEQYMRNNLLRLQAIADDGTGDDEQWRYAKIDIGSTASTGWLATRSFIRLDATGNHDNPGFVEIIGDTLFSGRTVWTSSLYGFKLSRLRAYLPESSDDIYINDTQLALDYNEIYVDPSDNSLKIKR